MLQTHGCDKVQIDESIITISLSGSFNEQSISELVNEIKSAVNSFENKKFAILLYATEAEGFTPEAYQELDDYNAWLNNQNFVAKAIVSHSPTLQQTSELFIPSRKPQLMKRFEDIESAQKWLKTFF
jgi:hypothetical protein